MPMDFPSSPTIGQIYSPTGGPVYTWDGSAWMSGVTAQNTAETRNRIVNGAMQISQENGNTAGTANGYYAADQWFVGLISTGTISFVRYPFVTPNRSVNRVRLTINTADTSLTTNEQLGIWQNIEGIRVADFGWGTAAAKQVILRFGFYSTIAGTFSAAVRGGGRVYVAPFTVAAATETEVVLVIPGDTAGTWATNTSLGMSVVIMLASGPTGLAPSAGWHTSTNYLIPPGTTNGLGTVSANFYLSDVGLYLDPLATGLPPCWQMPDEAEELLTCQRYWYNIGPTSFNGHRYGAAGITLADAGSVSFPVTMRVVPAGAATVAPSLTNCSAFSVATQDKDAVGRVTVTALGTYRAANVGLSFSARM